MVYSFVCPGCRAGEHDKCPGGNLVRLFSPTHQDSHSYGRKHMLKRIGAGVAVLAVTALTLLVAPAAAQAATRTQLPYEVSFAPDPAACDGKVQVKTANRLKGEHAVGLTFKINSQFVNVDPDTTTVTVVSYPDSKDINVDLVGFYDATPGGDVVLTKDEAEKRAEITFVTHWEYQWERPDGCWDVKVVSLCGGGLGLVAKNTSPAPGEIIVQPDTTDAVEVLVAGNATFTATYPVATLTVSVDGVLTTYNFKQPVCATPTPSTIPTTAPPVGRDTNNDLPATGAAGAEMSVVGGTIALFTALAGGLALWLIRRSRRQTSQSS